MDVNVNITGIDWYNQILISKHMAKYQFNTIIFMFFVILFNDIKASADWYAVQCTGIVLVQ